MNESFDTNKYIPVVIAFTPNYFVPAATCLFSLFKSAAEGACFHIICLVSEEFPEHLKQALQSVGGPVAHYTFYNLGGKLDEIYVSSQFTEATLYRLLLPDLLPDVDKVIYIDCDMIIRNDLSVLYHSIDLKDNYLAAVFEVPFGAYRAYIKEVGLDPDSYVNAGMLIMNLRQLRVDKMSVKLIDALKSGSWQFFDQDVLNLLCRNRIVALPPYYNAIRTFCIPAYRNYFLQKYTAHDWEEVQAHGTIHYTSTKPWKAYAVNFALWWQYYRCLPLPVKREWTIDRRIYWLYKIYDWKLGFMVDSFRSLYRKLRKND